MSTDMRKRPSFRQAVGLGPGSSPSSPSESQPDQTASSSPMPSVLYVSSTPPSPSSQHGQLAVPAPASALPLKQLASSTPNRDLWEKARECLAEKDKETICRYWSVGTDPMPEALLEAAKAKQKMCEDKRWIFQFKDNTVNLQEKADKVVSWLEKFKSVGDIMITADPVHAGLPWAAIRPLLQV